MSKSSRSKLWKIIFLTGVVFSLSACGGGSPTVTPPPPPPPPPETNDSLADLQHDESFAAVSSAMGLNVSGADLTGSTPSVSGIDGNSTVSYNASNQSFDILINQAPHSYSTIFVVGDINSSMENTIEVENAEGDTFSLLNPGLPYGVDPDAILQYMTLGGWVAEGNSGFAINTGWTVFGVQTTEADMPTSGTVEYTGLTKGTLANDNTIYALSGDVAVTADFSTGDVNLAFNVLRAETFPSSSTPVFWRDFTGTASISSGANFYSGTTVSATDGLTGFVEGAFFGPGALETGGVWSLTGGPENENATGAFGAGQ